MFPLLFSERLGPVIVSIGHKYDARLPSGSEHSLLVSTVYSARFFFDNPAASELGKCSSCSSRAPLNWSERCFFSLLIHDDDRCKQTQRNKHQGPQHR